MLELTEIPFSILSLLILFINVLLTFKILKLAPDVKWFCILQVWALLIQIFSPKYSKYFGNNLPLLHLYTLFEFVFLSLFYWTILLGKQRYGKYFSSFVVLIVCLIVGNSIFLEPLTSFNTNAKGLSQVIIMAYTIIYFFNRMSIEVQTKNLILNRINAAILLYYAGSLFVFTFAQFIEERSDKVLTLLWMFNSILYLVFQLLILIATWRLVFPKKKIADT